MRGLEYSAGAVSKGFWFIEFKKYIELLQEGQSDKEIKELQENENFLMAPSVEYGKKMTGEIKRRIKALPKKVLDLFSDLNVSDQKIINLLGIMITDRLFFEFIYEVYRNMLILGRQEFEDSQLRVYFNNKSEQSEKVAGYTVEVKRRLGVAYKTYLKESNLIKEEDGSIVYNKIIMELRLEEMMKNMDLMPYFKAITGVE